MVTIRAYDDCDYESVRRNLIEGKLYEQVWDSRENLATKINRDPDSILVAEVDGQVVGSVYIMADGWSAFIYRLVVGMSARQHGIGTRLMEAAEEQLRSKGVPEVALFVNADNTELQRWYEKRGYGGTHLFRCMWKALTKGGQQ